MLFCAIPDYMVSLKISCLSYVPSFREYMNSGAVTNPPGVEKVFEFMLAEQAIMSAKRLELIESVGSVNTSFPTLTFF